MMSNSLKRSGQSIADGNAIKGIKNGHLWREWKTVSQETEFIFCRKKRTQPGGGKGDLRRCDPF